LLVVRHLGLYAIVCEEETGAGKEVVEAVVSGEV